MRISSTRRGFTMTEMLAVIAVVALLAALLLPAIKNSMQHAEVNKAQLAITQLQTAFKAYYTEYGKWPATATTGGGIMCTTNWMVALLRGEDKNADATVFWRNWEPETVKLAELDGRPYHAMTVVQSRFIGCETFSATKGTAGFGIRSTFSECWRKT